MTAEYLTACASLIVALTGVAAVLLSHLRQTRQLTHIDRAVNDQPPGEPRLIEHMRAVRIHAAENTAAIGRVEDRVGDLADDQATHLQWHREQEIINEAARQGRINRREHPDP